MKIKESWGEKKIIYRKEHFKWLIRGPNQRERVLLSHKAVEMKRTAHIPLGQGEGSAGGGMGHRIETMELLKWKAGPNEV